MLDKFTHDYFAAHTGSAFMLAGITPAVALVLTEAMPLRNTFRDRQAFSLLFRGPEQPVLAQRIHALSHPELGALEIFLVPVGRDASAEHGMLYQAVFT